MNRLLFVVLCLFQCLGFISNAQTLKSGHPIMSGETNGYAPYTTGAVVSMHPLGTAKLRPNDKAAALFVLSKTSVGEDRGYFYMEYLHSTPDGAPVFGEPKRIYHFFGGSSSRWPVSGQFFNYNGSVYSLWQFRNSTVLALGKFDPVTNQLTRITDINVGNMANVSSISVKVLKDNSIEITMLYSENKRYRPERDPNESYYDGANIWKGNIVRGGVKSAVIQNFNQSASATIVTSNTFMQSATGAIRFNPDENVDGYVVCNSLSSLAWIDIDDSLTKQYVWNKNGQQHSYLAYSPTMSTWTSPDGKEGIIMCGEGWPQYFEYEGKNERGIVLSEPKVVLMEKGALNAGSLCVPDIADWNGDGVLDMIVGNSEGRLLYYRNNGSNLEPIFATPEYVESAGKPICFRPGYIDIQGPLEAIWGYLCPKVFDWNQDGLPDVIFSDATARIRVMLNEGTRGKPSLAAPESLSEDNLELYGTWRVRPAVAKIGGRICMVHMDKDNALHLYWKLDDFHVEDGGKLYLVDGKQITGHRAEDPRNGMLGRGKLYLEDWDGDGVLDLIVGCQAEGCFPSPDYGIPGCVKPNGNAWMRGTQSIWFKNMGTNENMSFAYPRLFQFKGEDFFMGKHSTAPTPCMLGDTSSGPNMIIGAETGKLYFFNHNDLTDKSMDELLVK